MTEAVDFESAAAGTFRNWLHRRIPRPRPGAPAAAPVRPAKLLILHKGSNPTLEYYLMARARALGIPCQFRCIDSDRLDDLDPDNLFLIICRYVRPRQVRWIARHHSRLSGIAYFIDDDVPSIICDSEIEAGYRLYLAYLACLPFPWLNGLLTHLWVSTDGLARALEAGAAVPASVLGPAPVMADHLPPDQPAATSTIRIAYHATHLHHREHKFLVPVMEEVIRLRPQTSFEVLAGGRSNNLWRKAAITPRSLSLVAPLKWEDYRRHCRGSGANIALMPLLEGQANESRADTKLIDCARLGAAALMSDVSPYRRGSSTGVPKVRNSVRDWVEAILALIDQTDKREQARKATRESVLRMTFCVDEPFPGVICNRNHGYAK